MNLTQEVTYTKYMKENLTNHKIYFGSWTTQSAKVYITWLQDPFIALFLELLANGSRFSILLLEKLDKLLVCEHER